MRKQVFTRTNLPAVSICIPAYNAEPFIGQTMETILNQTFQDFEIIVSDNNSTDHTTDIIKCYQEKDPRISLTICPIQRKDGSLSSESLSAVDNFNHLICLAKNEFIALYHADDLYHRDILGKEVDFLRQHEDVSAVFSMGRLLESKGTRVSRRSICLCSTLKMKNVFHYDELLYALVEKGMLLMTPTCLVRRRVIPEAGLFQKTYEQAADYDYWLRIAQTGPIGLIDEALILYRVGAHQDSFRGQTLYRYKHLPATKLFEDHVRALPDSHVAKSSLLDSIERIKLEQDLRVAGNLLLDGKDLEASRMLEQAIKAIGNKTGMARQTQIRASLLTLAAKFRMAKVFIRIYDNSLQILRLLKWRKRPLVQKDLVTIV